MPIKRRQLTQSTLYAYLAGVFDGEGTIVYRRKSGRNVTETPALDMCVQMTEAHIVQMFSDAFGGRVVARQPKNERYKTMYIWRVTYRKAEHAYDLMAPYIRLKTRTHALRNL